jgi:hypothetical protein
MHSSVHAKLVTRNEIRIRVPGESLPKLRLDPGRWAGDVFTAGPAEIFVRA